VTVPKRGSPRTGPIVAVVMLALVGVLLVIAFTEVLGGGGP
jgi:hypothetical protein